jgi:hypothetical protein
MGFPPGFRQQINASRSSLALFRADGRRFGGAHKHTFLLITGSLLAARRADD